MLGGRNYTSIDFNLLTTGCTVWLSVINSIPFYLVFFPYYHTVVFEKILLVIEAFLLVLYAVRKCFINLTTGCIVWLLVINNTSFYLVFFPYYHTVIFEKYC